MKKLIYLILFIPVIGFGQTYPHQIEPDTTHRMIMMTDTSVIDSPAMEFLYFSIDSLVEQIARDTLGLDSTYWSLDDSLSLSPVNQTNNIILGSLSGNTIFTGTYNFLAGGSLGNNLTTGGYNTLFGVGNLSSLTTGIYNFSFGNGNGGSDANTRVSFLGGFQNARNATNIDNSFVFGDRNNDSGAALIDNSTLLGQYNVRNATDISDSFISGYNNGGGTGFYNQVFISGRDNHVNGNNIQYSFINGSQNLYSSLTTAYVFSNGFQNAYSADVTNYSFFHGRENLRNATRAWYNFASGYRNLYQTTSQIINAIAIGTENGYNAVDHSNSIYLGYRQGYTTGGTNKLKIGMTQDSPLIDGDFSTSEVTINDDLYVNSLETSDYLYSTSDQILGGNWVDGDWTLTGNIDTLFFGDPSNIDTVVVSAGDPDQTLSFSDPNLTISGSGGNTIDISGVNYWDTNADGIYTLDNVGINTTPHATHPLYVVGTMWLDGPVRDGNGNFSGGTGNIMTANSSGEFLWESPSSISLSEFNNDLGLTQYWSLVGSDLFSNTGGAARDIIVGEIDMELPISGTPDQLMGRISSTGILNDINIGSGLSLSSGTLSATATSSPWTDNGLYVSTTNNEDVYIAAGESIGLATTIPSSSYQIDGDTDSAIRLRGDLYDKNSDNGASGDVLMSDGDQIVWVTKGSAQLEDAIESTSSTTYVDLNFTSGGSWGITGSTTTDDFSIPYTGVYKLIASGGNSSTGQCVVQFERNGTGIYELNIGTGHDQNNTGTFTPAAFSFHYIASFTAGDDITMAFKAGTNTCVLDDIVFSIETMSVVGGI